MENKNNFFWKVIIGMVLILVIIAFFKGFFDKSTDTVEIVVPEIKGSTKAVKPINIPLEQNLSTEVKKPSTEPKYRTPENKDYQKLIDSLRNRNIELEIAFAKSRNKDSLYREAIKLHSFNQVWDNDTIKLIADGITRGTLESIKVNWDIKERKQSVKVPQKMFTLLAGVETGMTKSFDKFNAKANIGIQNKKGNIITVSVDSEQRFYVGYTVSVFSVKR